MTKRSWFAVTLVLDAVLLNLGFILAFLIRFKGELPPFNFEAYLALVIPITLLQLVIFGAYELYDPQRLSSRLEIFSRLLAGVSLGSLLVIALTFFLRQFSFPRLVILIAWALTFLLILGGRLIAASWFRIRWPARRVLVVGDGPLGHEVAHELGKRAAWGYEVVGVVSDSGDIASMVNKEKIDQVVVTTPSRHRELIDALVSSEGGSIQVDVVPELYEIYIGRPEHTLLSDMPIVSLTTRPVAAWQRVLKRLFDIVLALLILPFFLVVLPVLAILVKGSSKGPVFFIQERVGRRQRRFRLIKFRTMAEDAERLTGPVMAGQLDPRTTKVGRYLRRTRLDELPQIINILLGKMSFVGPRPEREHFVERFKSEVPGYSERFSVSPGLTGLAQVSGHYATNAANKLKYDLIYIRHQSLLLDLKIILHTVRVILRGRE